MSAPDPRPAPDRLLTLGAVVGAAVLLAAVALALTGSRPVAFRSGSMAPTIPTGSAALVHEVPAAQLRVGDVVTVRSGDSSVTHRIVQLTRRDGTATIQLQGDANTAPDAELHEVRSAERVVASVPWLGFLLGALGGPAGLLLAGGYLAWVLSRTRSSRSARSAPAPGGRHRGPRAPRSRRRRPALAGATLAVGAVGAVVVVATAPHAVAAWADTTSVSGSTVTAATVPPPATFTCGGVGALSVSFAWSPVPGAVDYDLHWGPGGTNVTRVSGTSYRFTTALDGGTAWVQANVPYAATTWTSTRSTTRSYSVALVSLCS